MGVFQEILGLKGRIAGYQDVARQKVTGPVERELEQMKYDLNQQRTAALLQQQAAGFAKQMGREGMQQDPMAQRAVGLMMQPGSRQAGLQLAGQVLATPPQGSQPMQSPQIGAPSFNDFTPDSMAEYQQTGDPRKLQYRQDPNAEERLQIARDAEDRKRLLSGRLPAGQMENMIQTELVDAGLDSTAQQMKPEYFGFKLDSVANAAQEYKARMGSDTEFTSFWNEVDSNQAIRRHALFGATLTEGENAAWNKIALKPSDAYASAAAKLKAQKRLVDQKRKTQGQVLQGQGYNVPPQRPPLSQFVNP